jgi:N12 class adenine-specific DNA methylase
MREVTVRAGEIPPKIWINPSIRVNSCAYKITMRHELEHVKNHNTYLAQFKVGVKSNFPKMLGRKGYVMLNNGRSTAQAQAQIRNSVTQILHAINRKYDAIADRKDQHMDTPSNYRREFAPCR